MPVIKKRIAILKCGAKRVCPEAKKMTLICLKISCAILILSLFTVIRAGQFSANTYELHYLSAELYRIPLTVLIVGVILSAMLEERK